MVLLNVNGGTFTSLAPSGVLTERRRRKHPAPIMNVNGGHSSPSTDLSHLVPPNTIAVSSETTATP